jgi:hypothetical protein
MIYDKNTLFSGCDELLLARFKKFHLENPVVYDLFVKFATEAKNSNRVRFSHWMIINRIRWYSAIETTGEKYKISNDFIALYARLLVYHDESFFKFFSLKEMKAKRKNISL